MPNKWKVWSKFIFRNDIHTIVEIKEDWEWEYIVSDKCEDCWYIWESDKKLLPEDWYNLCLEEYSKLDLDNPDNWRSNCSECGKLMIFHKESFTYKCSCGNTLEV